MEEWIVFTLNDKELIRITTKGCFPGEIQETKSLLAYENNCSVEDITIKIV